MIPRTIFFLIVFFSNQLIADHGKFDNPVPLANKQRIVEHQVDLFNEIAFNSLGSDPNKTLDYSKKAYQLSLETNYEFGIAVALKNKGIAQHVKNRPTESLKTFNQVLQIAEVHAFNELWHSALNYCGNIYFEMGQIAASLEYFQKSVLIAKKEGDIKSYCEYAINLNEILISNGELDKAYRQFEIIFPLAKDLNSQEIMGDFYSGMGKLFYEKKAYDRSLDNSLKALKLYTQINSPVGRLMTLTNIAKIHFRGKAFEKSKTFNEKALRIALKNGISNHIARCYNLLAKDWMALEDYLAAKKMATASLHHAKIANYQSAQLEALEILVVTNEQTGYFETGLNYMKQVNMLKGSLFAKNESRKIRELEFKYDSYQKKYALLKNQETVQLAKAKRNNLVFGLIGFALLLVGTMAISFYRANIKKGRFNSKLQKELASNIEKLAKSNKNLKQSNKELERFSHIASHDLKEPLRNINSFIRLIERRLVGKDKYLKEYMQYVQNNAQQMNILIEDVLEYSEFDQKKIKFEEVDLNMAVQQVKMAIKALDNEGNVKIGLPTRLPMIVSNSSQVYLLLKNLVENGIRFNDKSFKQIKISYKLEEGFHILSVVDNGIGIEEQYRERIFEMFERLQNREEYTGSGLGLSLCKKIVKRLGGEIWVDATNKNGSTFIVKLPVFNLPKEMPKMRYSRANIQEELVEVKKEVRLVR